MIPDELSKKSNRKLLIILAGIVVGMFGFCFALVPMYTLICKTEGVNGKTGGPTDAAASNEVDTSRYITVQFLASTNAYLPWKFYPENKFVKIHPGENKLVHFYAENNSGQKMTVQAVPSVTPGLAAKYIRKTECFCFTQQTFAQGEKRDMPVLFHVDPGIPNDIRILSLSYTMFNAEKYKKVVPAEQLGHL